MKLDRTTFLALATALSAVSAVACSASAPEGDDTADELNEGSACVDPSKDALAAEVRAGRAYPVAEGCYNVGETWGQCNAWVNHFEVGTSRQAFELYASGKEPYDAGYEALTSACKLSEKNEARLAAFCKGIVKLQVAAGGAWTRNGGASTNDAAKLQAECVAVTRGIKLESRAALRSCTKKTPDFGVYSCVEGLGFDETKARCVDPSVATSASRTFECQSLGGESCEAIKALYLPAVSESVLGCVEEGIIIRTEARQEAGTGVTEADFAKEISTDLASCLTSSLQRSCQKPQAEAACGEIVGALQRVDAKLAEKGHVNAGGAFTKRCNKMLSGLNEAGLPVVKSCLVSGAADVVKSKLSIEQCALKARPATTR